MSIATDSIQYDLLPVTGLLQAPVSLLQIHSRFGNFLVLVEQARIVGPQSFNFTKEVVLVSFGMRFVETGQLALQTSSTRSWAVAVTLKNWRTRSVSIDPVTTGLINENS